MMDRFFRGTAARLGRQLERMGRHVARVADPGAGTGGGDTAASGVCGSAGSTPIVADDVRAVSYEDIDWFQSIDFGGGLISKGVKSLSDLEGEFATFGLDRAQLEGRTVLDVGTADGWNALRCEGLGASVTAIDGVYRDGLRYVRRKLAPRFRFFQMEVNGPSFLELGQFDVVLYLGVLYHTVYPYEQMVRVAGRCRDTLLLESAYLNLPGLADEPTLTFNFDGHITSDLSSPAFPSVSWITQALGRLGFRRVDVLRGGEGRLGRVIVRALERDRDAAPVIFAAEQVHV